MKTLRGLMLVAVSLLPMLRAHAVVWYPLPGEAYAFSRKYPEAQRLLFAFDYGHALVYEKFSIPPALSKIRKSSSKTF